MFRSFRVSLTEKDFCNHLNSLIEDGNGRVVIAFSGGCDSLALLVLCTRALTSENVIPCYVNHRLRPDEELEREIELNRQNCKRLGLDLVVQDLGKGSVEELALRRKGGIEEAARLLRYECLNRIAVHEDCSYIVTAHHLDDQIETVVMRLLRKSPDVSLRGISEKRFNIIRPLLKYSKKELEDYLKAQGFEWSTDSTNYNNSFERNKIRNEYIPKARLEDPDFDTNILAIRDKALEECADFEIPEEETIDYAWFKSLGKVKQQLVLYSYWDRFVHGILPQTLINRVINADDDTVISANGGTFSIYNGKIYVTGDESIKDFEGFECPVEDTVLPGDMTLKICNSGSSTDIFIEKALIDDTFRIRFAKEGDIIVLKNGTKLVSKLLQDNKIPPVLRKKVPVLVSGKNVLAVFGSVYGGRNRICQSLRTSLAPEKVYSYIIISR